MFTVLSVSAKYHYITILNFRSVYSICNSFYSNYLLFNFAHIFQFHFEYNPYYCYYLH